MNARLEKTLIALAISAFSLAALASDKDCTAEPKAKWPSEKDAQSSLEKQGYKVKRIKTEGSCYEAKATDKDGTRVELLINPANGQPAKDAGKA